MHVGIGGRHRAAAGDGPRERVDRDDGDEDQCANGDLGVGGDAEEVHAVGQHAERQHAEEGAEDPPAAAEQARAADQRGGDREQGGVVAELHRRGVEPRREQHAGNGGKRSAQHVGEQQIAVDRDAGEIGRLAVSADRIEVAARPRALEKDDQSAEDQRA